jgi:thioredoxin-related protein
LEVISSLPVNLASKQFVCVAANISKEVKEHIKDEKLNAIKKLQMIKLS